MSDDQITIDGNQIYRHMKKLYSEKEYRQRYNKLDFYKPTDKQRECHNNTSRYLLIRAGNRSGKTTFACAETAYQLLGMRPSWHQGFWAPRPKIARSEDFAAWMIGPTSVVVRDVMQAQILGGTTQDTLGTGWIPLSALRHQLIFSRGISGLVDKVSVTRSDGKLATLSFKTQEMSADAFQGSAIDLIILDEDPGKAGEQMLPELLARLIGTGGRFIHSATPRAGGNTALRKFFREQNRPERGEIRASIYDNSYLTPEDIKAAEGQYSERERMTRLYGDDLPGFGAVINLTEETYLHNLRSDQVPAHWPWINGMDMSHFGLSSQAHPWAFVSCCLDPSTFTMYVMQALRIKQQLAPVHVAALKKWENWDAPCAWGADGNQRDSSGSTFAGIYKALGVPLRSTHATLKDGSVSLEATISLMEMMLSQGKLKIGSWLTELREELRDWHFDDNNKVVAEQDDLVSALRYAVMDQRYAKVLGDLQREPSGRPWSGAQWAMHNARQRQASQGQYARGTVNRDDFNVLDPDE